MFHDRTQVLNAWVTKLPNKNYLCIIHVELGFIILEFHHSRQFPFFLCTSYFSFAFVDSSSVFQIVHFFGSVFSRSLFLFFRYVFYRSCSLFFFFLQFWFFFLQIWFFGSSSSSSLSSDTSIELSLRANHLTIKSQLFS